MRLALPVVIAGGCFAAVLTATGAVAQDIKIGTIYDLTGPFAGGGSKPAFIGNKIAIDMINEKGGVEGHKIVAIDADAQSKVDVAINEAERLLNEAKVDLLMGVYSSAQCVPLAAKVDAAKKFLWMNVCVSSAVFKDKNLTYAFRPTIHSDQYGEATCSFIAENAKGKLGKDPKDVKVAIIHEDGPYGVGVGAASEERCKALGIQVVHKEGYSATATDLSALVTKLRRTQPDIIVHAGYNPDITLFLRQAKEAGLKFSALIGEGAGYGQIDKLRETFKDDVNYIYNVDPVAGAAARPKDPQAGRGRDHRRDGEALQGRDGCQRGAAARLDGVQPGLDLPDRRAAAGHQEVRRLGCRGLAQGRARYRHSTRRYHSGLWREVLPAR